MKLITPPLVVGDSDGFTNDIFERKSFGDSLLGLIKHSDDGLVISLDSQWGEGKTTFIKMWQGALKEEKIANIYIDAFQNDYNNDAFITIASAIIAYTEKHCPAEKAEKAEIKAEILDAAKKLGVKLLPIGGKIALKLFTLNLIDKSDIEALKTIKDDVATGISDAAEKMIEERLNAQTKDIDLVETFKTKLRELAKKISEQGNGKLVIIIDELDRCRPSFAVEILEKIKHFFSVPNVFFVLVMHKQQLECAVKHIYGDEIVAHTYLQKFIHVETTLPKRNDDFRSNIKTYIEQLFKLHEISVKGSNNKELVKETELINYLDTFSKHFKLSLRELEKVFANLVIIYSNQRIKIFLEEVRIYHIIAFVAIIKVKHPKIFDRLQLKDISYDELDVQLSVSKIPALSGYDNNTGTGKSDYLPKLIKNILFTDSELKALTESNRSQIIEDDCTNARFLSTVIEALSLFKIS